MAVPFSVLCIPWAAAQAGLGASTASTARTPRAWADEAARQQIALLEAGHSLPVRYREQRTDERGTSLRAVIETEDGNVARTLERNGRALTPEQEEAEKVRLNDILQDPGPFLKRHRRADPGRNYALELVQQLPKAMLWSYTPGQPRLGGVARPQVVLDFTPDPQYKPSSMLTEGLQGLSGRAWVDVETGCVLRIEGHTTKPVEFGWGGMLARVGQGGTVSLEQRLVGGHRWVYTALQEDLTIREVLVHTAAVKAQVTVSDAELLPHPVSLQEGIHTLLAMSPAAQ